MTGQPAGEEPRILLPQLRIDQLLDELQARLDSVRSTRDRVRQLLEAVVGIGSGLDIEQALARIVQAAVTLVDAKYGALGVVGEQGDRLSRFITVGLTEGEIAAIGPYPEGHGVLGELIRHPTPLRIEDLTAHPNSYGFPANHPPMHSFLGVPVRVRDKVFGNLYLTEKRGGAQFDEDDEAMLLALAAAAGVAIDNARLYDEARRRQEWLEATSELSRDLLSGADADDPLAAFAQRARRFAAADLAVIALPSQNAADLMVVAADGEGSAQVHGLVLGLENTLMGAVYKSAHLEVLANAQEDSRAGRDVPPGVGLGPSVIVPLGPDGQVRGVMALSRLSGAPHYDAALVQLIADLAAQAAVVLELAERRRDGELLALYADRDRIGRDLHDMAIQQLFATSMGLQGAYKITQKPAVARRIAQAITDLDETIKVIRSTIFALHAHENEDRLPSVRTEVTRACEQAGEVLGYPATVRISGPVDHVVGEETAEHLLAVLREALSNAARHAHASHVEVDLTADTGSATLTVADDGVGISAGGRRSGLANMRERAEQLGGTFTVRSRDGGGTVLVWTVPSRLGGVSAAPERETTGATGRVEGP